MMQVTNDSRAFRAILALTARGVTLGNASHAVYTPVAASGKWIVKPCPCCGKA